jgi:hypothetical protein
MLSFLMVAFFTPLIPILPVIAFIGLVYKYWIEKIILLRRNKFPEQFAEQMAFAFSNLIPFSCFLYSLGQFVFVNTLSEGENIFPQIALWVSLVYLIIPFRYFFRKCEGNISRDDEETFSKNKVKFLTDYPRSNPVTCKEATLAHLTLLEEQEKSLDRLQELKQQKLMILKGGDFGNLVKYAEKQKEFVSQYRNRFNKEKNVKNLVFALHVEKEVTNNSIPMKGGIFGFAPAKQNQVLPFKTQPDAMDVKNKDEED